MHLQRGRLMAMRKSKATVKPVMEAEPTQVTVPANAIPSEMAIRHQGQIQVLESQFKGIETDLNGLRNQLGRLENSLNEFASEVRNAFAKRMEKNPMVYIGIATVTIGVLTIASGLTIFTINSIHAPTRDRSIKNEERIEVLTDRWLKDHEELIRIQERQRQSSVNGQP